MAAAGHRPAWSHPSFGWQDFAHHEGVGHLVERLGELLEHRQAQSIVKPLGPLLGLRAAALHHSEKHRPREGPPRRFGFAILPRREPALAPSSPTNFLRAALPRAVLIHRILCS